MTLPPKPAPLKPKVRVTPLRPPKPMPPSGSSKLRTHPSNVERVALASRTTRSKLAEVTRRGGK